MPEDIFFNIMAGLSAEDVDRLNDRFYGRFNYPWAPMLLPSYRDPGFWAQALNTDLGYYDAPVFGAGMDIWVAGCGTNQAVLTALKFPQARVIGKWEMGFEDAEVARAHAAVPDLDRWQVTNLLRGEASPRLWFYLQRANAPRPCPPARELTGAFLDTVFEPNVTTAQGYVLGDAQEYHLSPTRLPCPAPARPSDRAAAAVFAEVDGKRSMQSILDRLGVTTHPERLRLQLATSGYPYLRPVQQSG